MPETEILHTLFEVMKQFVWDAGGDGDGWIVSERFAALADKFESYEKGQWFRRSYEVEGAIHFGNNQESISFVRNRSHLPNWAGDIVVEIH